MANYYVTVAAWHHVQFKVDTLSLQLYGYGGNSISKHTSIGRHKEPWILSSYAVTITR